MALEAGLQNFVRIPRDLGHAIRQARRGKNLTQADLATRSGVWQETISKVEAGRGGTKLDTILALLAALDLELLVSTRSKGSTSDFDNIFD
ncbi:helix-turn-helix domain-containing protein [Sulfitobacter mediterraneus]|uniref:helix-turn-helix domain-containing protein n=1 Tax=Sulfitobacter mediterraneus TaxID=83219 RepID=UPI001E4AC691|nr:helix-turn-helix transcriptional regulator [Sulfitobacter mediterraneus]MCD2359168.1 helix-turn-helix domain-containing protein [Sulfitobacter mediterraneus]